SRTRYFPSFVSQSTTSTLWPSATEQQGPLRLARLSNHCLSGEFAYLPSRSRAKLSPGKNTNDNAAQQIMPMLAHNAEKFVILNLAMSTDFLSAMVPQPCWSDVCVKPILGFDRGSEILLLQALYWLAVCANNGTADERPAACTRELRLWTPCPSTGAGVREVEASVICIVRSLMHGRHPRQIIWLT